MIEYPKIETLFERSLTTHKVTSQIRRPEFLAISRWIITEKIDGMNIRVRITPRTPPSDAGVVEANVEFGGRTDRAQLPVPLLKNLKEMFTQEVATRVWEGHDQHGPFEVVLFGEGYGPGIQKVGSLYTAKPNFRLFDVFIPSAERYDVMVPEAYETLRRYLDETFGQEQSRRESMFEEAVRSYTGMWLEWPDVQDVARKLGIQTVPVLSEVMYADSWTERIRAGQVRSSVAENESSLPGTLLVEGIVGRSNPLLFNRSGKRAIFKLKTSDF